MSEPSVALKSAELLHVTLATMAHVVERETNYPVRNINLVIKGYREARDQKLLAEGMTPHRIEAYTSAAADALAAWLEDKAETENAARADFAAWTEEFDNDF